MNLIVIDILRPQEGKGMLNPSSTETFDKDVGEGG